MVTFKKTRLSLVIVHTIGAQQIETGLHRGDRCRVSAVGVGHVRLVAVVSVRALHFLLFSLFKVPNISADPSVVSNQTSANLTCNLTGSDLPIKGSHWLFNGKPVENSQSTSSDPFTRLQ